MTTQQGQAFEDLRNTLSECVRIVRYRWRLALVGLCAVGALAFWYSQYLPREYLAATIFERRDDVVLQNLIQSNSPYSFEHLKTTMALDMTGSRALVRAAVRAGLLPADQYATEGALSEQERRGLDELLARYTLKARLQLIHSTPALDTIQLTCTASDPAVARGMVVALRDNYIEDMRARIRDILVRTRAFFLSEVTRLQEAASAADAAVRAGLEDDPGLDPTDLSAVGLRLEQVRTQHANVAQRHAELEAEIAARERFLQMVPAVAEDASATSATAALPPPVDPALSAAIDKVQAELLELMTVRRMTDQHPEVVARLAKLNELRTLRDSLRRMPVPGVAAPRSPAPSGEWQAQRQRVVMELDALRRQLDAVRERLAESTRRVERYTGLYEQLVGRGDEYRRLRDRRQTTTTELAIWTQHLAQLDRVLAAESGQRGTQFALVEEPKDVNRATKPRVATVFAVCAGLGLAAAALAIALAELFDRSFRSAGQVARSLGVPVLQSIGVIPTPQERRRRLITRVVWVPAAAMLLLALAGSAALAYTSLAAPGLHRSAIQRVDRVLNAIGISGVLPSGPSTT